MIQKTINFLAKQLNNRCNLRAKKDDFKRSHSYANFQVSAFKNPLTINIMNYISSQKQSSPINNRTKYQMNNKNISIKIMKSIQSFVQSQEFKKKFNSYCYLQKYSWICLHTWMILYKLKSIDKFTDSFQAYFLKKKIKNLLQQYTRDQVYEYNDFFDREVYQQLKRVQGVIFWSLDEYFVFDFKQKQLGQIIEEDLGLIKIEKLKNKKQQTNFQINKICQQNQDIQQYRWKKEEKLNQIAQYFLSKLQDLSNTSFEKIKTGNIQNWLTI